MNTFINLFQSKQERQEKYWLAISLGANRNWAYAMRDWSLSSIEQYFRLRPPSVLKARPDGVLVRIIRHLDEEGIPVKLNTLRQKLLD